ncbi:excisionase family DNA binding protein [Nocardiopsis mwathae]|uniref:Excisionase family DNA binding protein n=1 Tax=Nocardiopsis mwathae TaxID=1472723 RepID=A0A7X0D805_9ACTN|nr:helix-turn-helix domain-containing protein [Nocardiopsis mwathae]MBB6174276.1 excisionase family DNA binding protein [Nocardiopsis mwathae]
MARRFPPLSSWQLEVLKWISDGCPEGVMKGFTYKATAIALQGRRLVVVSKRRGSWSASVTDDGRYYLEHGTYPQREGPASDEVESQDATVRAVRRTAAKKPRAVKTRHVEIRETFMRYRVMVTRVQVAERYVRAADEEDAAKRVQAEFDRPYGYFGSWKTTNSEVEVIEAEQTTVIKPNPLSKEGPLLLSIKDAGKALGLSYSTVTELVNRWEIEHVLIGSRKYISREALMKFIEQNTHRGYHR